MNDKEIPDYGRIKACPLGSKKPPIKCFDGKIIPSSIEKLKNSSFKID